MTTGVSLDGLNLSIYPAAASLISTSGGLAASGINLIAGVSAVSTAGGGLALLAGESQGLGIDFTVSTGAGSVAVKDTGTPANNRNNVAASTWLNVTADAKWILNSSGIYVQSAANNPAIEYSGGYYLLVEPAATNLGLQSRDLTNVAWTPVTMNTAKTATGADGTANGATTITAAGPLSTILQVVVAGSAAYAAAASVKRRTGTGTVEFTVNGGVNWLDITSLINTSIYTRISTTRTVLNPSFGFRITTSGDAIDVDFTGLETGTIATSPIVTVAATATRAADNINVATSAFPLSATSSTLYAQYMDLGFSNNMYAVDLNNGTSSEFFGVGDGGSKGRTIVVDGGVTQATLNANNSALNVVSKIAAAMALNDVASSYNGNTIETDATATLPTVTKLNIGGPTGVVAGSPQIGRVYQIVYLPRRMSNAELVAKAT